MTSSDFHVDITSDIKKHFDMAMTMAFDDAPGGKAEAYAVTLENGLVLYWQHVNNTIRLPYDMPLEPAINFIWGWLQNVDFAPYSQPVGGDGSDKKGFKVYTYNRNPYAFVAIKPYYNYYGK